MLNFILYKTGQFLALHIPLKTGYFLAECLSYLFYLISAQDRRAVRDNLAAIFPEKSEKEIRLIEHHVFRNFGKYLVDFFRFSQLNRDYIEKNVRIVNRHYLDDSIARGKGTILLTAHLGNWELGGVILALLGYPIAAVALPHKNKSVNDFFNEQRESKGVRIVPLGKAVAQCLSILKSGGILGLLGDRDFTEKGVRLEFFRRHSIFPPGPAYFSLKTQAQIIPGFMLRNGDNSFTLHLEKPLSAQGNETTGKNIKETIEQYTVIFERYIREYPEQWYMFRRFWIPSAPGPSGRELQRR